MADCQQQSEMVGRESPPAGLSGYHDESQVTRFYQGQVVLITGGTSFLGKVLLEKLLRSCPLKRIYLLVRNKDDMEPEARLESMLSSEMFQRVRLEVPEAIGKVKALSGDIAEPSLGLSNADKRILIDEVSIVFHLAATIRPNETFKQAVQLKVLGTRRTLDLCKQMRNLCALVHVSTAYSNWNKKEVHEMVYQTPIEPHKVIEATQDGLTIPTAAPVSLCRPTYLRVYNCTSGALKPHTWGDVIKELRRTMVQNPFSSSGSLPSFMVTSSEVLHHIALYSLRFVPEFLKDIGLRITGRQSRFPDRYEKALNAMNVVQLYTTNSWLFRTNNVLGLINDLNTTDKQLFNIDVRKLEWCLYWDQYVQGIRKFLLKSHGSELADSRKQFRRFNVARWFGYLALVVLAWRLAVTPTPWDISYSLHHFTAGLYDKLGFR
ncbi:fatty acyl-CoA reductase 1-like isoform X3 [Rhipicephalus microplus]|uniref:fatty acyl-CoA reductase 1-like isoform X3 n=1 Tax=Rhipicephalus microplus TaxID=6941 RepID=UPI003F6C9594